MPWFGAGAVGAGGAAGAGAAGAGGWVALASAGVAAYSAIEQGKAAERQGKREQAWREYEAQLAEREAGEEQEAAAEEERKLRRGAAREKAVARTRYARAGTTLTGSPADWLEEYASEVEYDALQIRRGGQVGAQGLRSSAVLSRLAGRSALLRGRSRKRAGYYQAAGAIAGGIGSYAGGGYYG